MEGVRIGRVVLWSGCSTIPYQCRSVGFLSVTTGSHDRRTSEVLTYHPLMF
jgi:hypothetical protein